LESLKTILYFSIFRYPLKIEEIYGYTNHFEINETLKELDYLIEEKIISKTDDFYVYADDSESVKKRLKGNIQANKAIIKAKEQAKLISKFPYVEAVGVSGSLSKGYYDNESDIDFFLITTPNKLWICRTLLILYKKIFLFNSRKHFCVNYFISANQLEIEEKNLFTATELKTLIPMEGRTAFKTFYQNNTWVINDYFSKFSYDIKSVNEINKPIISKVIELVLNTNIGIIFDDLFKSITIRKWKAKFNFMNEEDFKLALKSTKNISKHHPLHFQKKVILSLNSKLDEVQLNYNIVVPKEHV